MIPNLRIVPMGTGRSTTKSAYGLRRGKTRNKSQQGLKCNNKRYAI